MSEKFLGHPVDPSPAKPPYHDIHLVGRFVTLVGTAKSHAAALFQEVGQPAEAALWDFMPSHPPADEAEWNASMDKKAASENPIFYTILLNDVPDDSTPEGLRPVGMCSYLNINLEHRTLELGHLMFGPRLARSRAATEAHYLLAKHAFEELNFRRYEWKANALNGPSARAATRLGFQYEGTFRQHFIVKGRNRDTVWYSMLDSEWRDRKQAMEIWLSDENFDEQGRQKKRLEECRASVL